MFVAVAQPAGVEGWRGQTHLVACIADLEVLACSGAAAGESVRLVRDAVVDGLACGACRRVWERVAEQLS